MKGLLKYLSPFAPDQSGAVAALYTYGGIIVICDAGGCTGNICGFDEPRWFEHKSAVFSAGLRDMDAILGRDDRLVEKLQKAADQLGGSFAALIGTPVPAVIATDYKALKRMAEKKCRMPVIALECTGTRLYDEGAEKAFLELFQTFADSGGTSSGTRTEGTRTKGTLAEGALTEGAQDAPAPAASECSGSGLGNSLGILGLIPLDVNMLAVKPQLEAYYKARGYDQVFCYGMGDGLEAVKHAAMVSKNIVVSPAALKTAVFLEKTFGTPYETAFPLLEESLKEQLRGLKDKRILVIHQQVMANEIRKELRLAGSNDVTCGTWFMKLPELSEEQDVHFETEPEFVSFVTEGRFDAVVGDKMFRRALRDFPGRFIESDHFAVSGTLW